MEPFYNDRLKLELNLLWLMPHYWCPVLIRMVSAYGNISYFPGKTVDKPLEVSAMQRESLYIILGSQFLVSIEGKQIHTSSQLSPGSRESEPGYNQLNLSLLWRPLTLNTSRGHSLCPGWANLTLWEGNNRNSLLLKPSVCLSQGRGGVLLLL